jgi:hypothetical protein
MPRTLFPDAQRLETHLAALMVQMVNGKPQIASNYVIAGIRLLLDHTSCRLVQYARGNAPGRRSQPGTRKMMVSPVCVHIIIISNCYLIRYLCATSVLNGAEIAQISGRRVGFGMEESRSSREGGCLQAAGGSCSAADENRRGYAGHKIRELLNF